MSSITNGRSKSSYQNGSAAPQRIEEIGISPEQLRGRRRSRQLLFASLLGILFAALFILGMVVHRHQTQAIEADSDDYYYTIPGTGKTTRPASKLDHLDLNTVDAVPSGCETTVLLMRHCEKFGHEAEDADGNQHCSYLGFERAHFLPTLFDGQKADGSGKGWPQPFALFALTSQRTENRNFREIETLIPLSNEYGLEIQSNMTGNKDMTAAIMSGLSTGHWCSKLVVVSWKHDKMGDLARRLGCSDCPTEYPDGIFDTVWQLKYVYDVGNLPVIRAFYAQAQQQYSEEAATPSNDRVLAVSDADEGETQPTPTSSHRVLKKLLKKKKGKGRTHQKKQKIGNGKRWSVYSSVLHQDFDPLQFSAKSGDYDGTSLSGGSWFSQLQPGTDSIPDL